MIVTHFNTLDDALRVFCANGFNTMHNRSCNAMLVLVTSGFRIILFREAVDLGSERTNEEVKIGLLELWTVGRLRFAIILSYQWLFPSKSTPPQCHSGRQEMRGVEVLAKQQYEQHEQREQHEQHKQQHEQQKEQKTAQKWVSSSSFVLPTSFLWCGLWASDFGSNGRLFYSVKLIWNRSLGTFYQRVLRKFHCT